MATAALTSKSGRGQTAYAKGVMAEATVIQSYQSRGYHLLRQRFRGQGGEIDLIMKNDQRVVFVEVKASKSHALAAHRLSARQMQRIYCSAEEFLDSLPNGQLTDARFDVALVDDRGCCEIIENAFGQA